MEGEEEMGTSASRRKFSFVLPGDRFVHFVITTCSPTSTKVMVGGPDGGDGGGGGCVVFEVDASVKSLCSLLSHYRARDGADGQGSYGQGNGGKNVVIKVRVMLVNLQAKFHS